MLDMSQEPEERLTDSLKTPSLLNRVICLPNTLEGHLVHHGETDKASAAIDINVDNSSDEKDMLGVVYGVERVCCHRPQSCLPATASTDLR
jgi:secreted Zn-dependent insulinase-like peptidase